MDIEINDLYNTYTCKCSVVLNMDKFNKTHDYNGTSFNFVCPVCKDEISLYRENY